MTEAFIHGIFPTPVYRSELGRELTSSELTFADKIKKDCWKSIGNIISTNNYILNEKPFINIKKELDKRVQDYFNKVLATTNQVTPYITQSWLNYTTENQFHHKHEHPNSLVSGVFYINCDENFDKIVFFKKDIYQHIKPEVKDWNVWNSESWFFELKTGDIILFPSSLTHMVETKKGNNTRISLAFNVFIKGTIGDNKDLTELIL